MIELTKTLELINWARQVAADNGVQLPAGLDPLWVGSGAMVSGAVLALWGGRLMRAGIVCAFMVAGAAVGKRLASSLGVDLLVGLVIGAGFAGLLGYLLYRWWLGLAVGLAGTLLVVATFSAPRLLTERQAFEDFRLGVGSGRYDTSRTSQYQWQDIRDYFWHQKPQIVYRSIGPAVLVGLLGAAFALLAPRMASVLGTSAVGVLLVCGGASVVLAAKYPAGWNAVQFHGRWAVGAAVCFWLFSLLYQLTHPTRPVTAAPVAPPAPPPSA